VGERSLVEKLENEDEYWRRFKEEGDQEARNDLIVQYAPLVKHVVGKMNQRMPPNVEYEDLNGYGMLGLIDAVEKFDHTRGIKFKTYAIPRIRGSILDELRARDWIPRSIRRKARRIDEAMEALKNRYGREPTEEEVAEYMGMTMEEFQDLLSEVSGTSLLSLDEMWEVDDSNERVPLKEAIGTDEEEQPDAIIDREEIKQLLKESIEELPEKERRVIVLYYYEDLTLREISDIFDLTESRVSQIHSKATSMLRSELSEFEEACSEALS
jgi:RNA polymerase sigma factor for flagellar operon FliA